MDTAASDYARAVPLNALTAYGLGPLARSGTKPRADLRSMRSTLDGAWAAVDTAGVIGRRLLTVVAALGGSATRQQIDFQTSAAEPGVIDGALERLEASRLLVVRADGGVELAAVVRDHIPGSTISMADPNAITTDALSRICRTLDVRAGTKKQDRIDSIAAAFADPDERERIGGDLSAEASALLARIVDAAGAGTTTPDAVGVHTYLLHSDLVPRFPGRGGAVRPEIEPLRELTSRGIVGISEWHHDLWIWREAWPFVGKPFESDWAAAPDPEVTTVETGGPRLPSVVGALDQAMRAWQASPPAALKNGDARIGKSDVRSTAKSIGLHGDTVDLASQLAISIGLLLRNVVGRSGRGRNQRVDEVWMADPAMSATWEVLAPLQRWARLVAEWCSPRIACGHQLLVNRHLVLWELSQLADGTGYSDESEFATWFRDRHASLGHRDAALECIADLRLLGVVTAGPVALTRLGRAVLADPGSVAEMAGPESSAVVVQADLTVIAPPDLRHDLVVGLDALADLESASGAMTYRLDIARITREVQAGRTATDIVDFLAGISSVPLPDTVVRLVHDAAGRAASVRVIAAPTVVAVADPADLATACAIKALKLTRITDTLAVTEVSHAKVRAALERKGLAPQSIVGGAARQARSSAEEASRAAERAAALRSQTGGRAGGVFEQHARALDEHARSLDDVAGRLEVVGPLTITVEMVDRLDTTGRP
ncbi:helicase-associated domain-containing protein [soil metagenome]